MKIELAEAIKSELEKRGIPFLWAHARNIRDLRDERPSWGLDEVASLYAARYMGADLPGRDPAEGEFRRELAFMEWASPEHAEELLKGLIKKYEKAPS